MTDMHQPKTSGKLDFDALEALEKQRLEAGYFRHSMRYPLSHDPRRPSGPVGVEVMHMAAFKQGIHDNWLEILHCIRRARLLDEAVRMLRQTWACSRGAHLAECHCWANDFTEKTCPEDQDVEIEDLLARIDAEVKPDAATVKQHTEECWRRVNDFRPSDTDRTMPTDCDCPNVSIGRVEP